MQTEIDTYISRSQASFNVQLLVSLNVRAWIHCLGFNSVVDLTTVLFRGFLFRKMDSSESWEPATVILKRSSYQIKTNNGEAVVISEKYSKELQVKEFSTLKLRFAHYLVHNGTQTFMCSSKQNADKSTVWILNTVCSDKLWWIFTSYKHTQCPVRIYIHLQIQ